MEIQLKCNNKTVASRHVSSGKPEGGTQLFSTKIVALLNLKSGDKVFAYLRRGAIYDKNITHNDKQDPARSTAFIGYLLQQLP